MTSNTSGPRFRPFASPNHHVTKGRYITSNDPRGYIPVYEYPLNGQWIMMDIDDGYILWTGIWKALGNSKADIVKMIDSQPDLASVIRRVRGGYLKIQGTWMPYEVALRLSRRVAWPIRNDLIPLFGWVFGLCFFFLPSFVGSPRVLLRLGCSFSWFGRLQWFIFILFVDQHFLVHVYLQTSQGMARSSTVRQGGAERGDR
ncbi:hypothetical protein AMATHDRAFT_154925 [Amanita thiersii Skay4041]|uniref:HTH APSES-type domain-containing protein n=1 Tax=Amanita thiersii Skay4041 TaxID=703135 RepID=A0A2A9NDY2_9AGAR|nr:hypothetical protein AMATHDRAFT_154925 [Amanita thiersii Skay4041]